MSLSAVWQMLYWAWVASEVMIQVLLRTWSGEGLVRDRGSLYVLLLTIFGSITAGTWIGAAHPHNIFAGALWVRPVVVVVLAIGLVLRWAAILTLGESFSVNVAIHATQKVHTTGLFRFVRHPSYMGLLIVLAALGLNTRNWMGLAVILIPAMGALLYRIHVEESALREAFGGEYEVYSRMVKRLIPGVY